MYEVYLISKDQPGNRVLIDHNFQYNPMLLTLLNAVVVILGVHRVSILCEDDFPRL